MTTTTPAPDLIPLSAAAVALGYKPASALVMVTENRFPYKVIKSGRYNMVDRKEILAAMAERKRTTAHITAAQHRAILKAHAEGVRDTLSPSKPNETVVEMLSDRKWLRTADVARAMGTNPGVVNRRAASGTLPFDLVADPDSPRNGKRALSLDVAEYLVSQEPKWPTAAEFAAVPSLGLAEIKHVLGDDAPAGANDPTTQVFLASRETISLADFALMLGITPEYMRVRVTRGHFAEGLVDVTPPKAGGGERKLYRVRSDYAAEQMNKG